MVGHGLNLHIVETTVPEYRRSLKRERIKHFSATLPRVDHIAFTCSDIDLVQQILDEKNVFYKRDEPKGTGIKQIFLFDPDGNVIEISNCAPPTGLVSCVEEDYQDADQSAISFSPIQAYYAAVKMQSNLISDKYFDKTERSSIFYKFALIVMIIIKILIE